MAIQKIIHTDSFQVGSDTRMGKKKLTAIHDKPIMWSSRNEKQTIRIDAFSDSKNGTQCNVILWHDTIQDFVTCRRLSDGNLSKFNQVFFVQLKSAKWTDKGLCKYWKHYTWAQPTLPKSVHAVDNGQPQRHYAYFLMATWVNPARCFPI